MKKGKSFYSYLRLLLAGRKGGEIYGCWTIPFLVNILTKDWGEIMVPHYVHQINIMSKAAASLICVCWLLGHMMSDSFLPTSLNAYLTYDIYIFSNIHIYLIGNSRDTDVSVRKLKRGGLDATCREGAAKTMQLQKKKKNSEHLVCWLEHRRSCDGTLRIQSIPGVWHLHTQSAKQEKSYGEVLLDLRQVHQCQETLFFSERMLWISSSVSGWILLMCKDIMNSAEDVKSHFNLFKRVTCDRLLFLKDNLKVAKIYGHEIITGTNGVNNYWPICM